MAVGDNCQVACDKPYQNQPPGQQSPRHGHENNPHPTPSSNRDQVKEPYPYLYQSQPQVRPTQSSESPLRTTGYGYGHNPPPIQPQIYQHPEPRPNRAQVNEHYSSPQEREEGGYGSSNGVGHQPPPTEAKMHEDRQQPQQKEAPSHGQGNRESDQFNVHEPNPPSVTVKPPIPSVSGHHVSKVTARVDPQTHTQSQPYPDFSTNVGGFADPNKRRFNGYKRKEVPSGAVGGHGTGHSYEQSSPHRGDERLPVPPADKQSLHVSVNVNVGQAPATPAPAPAHGSGQTGNGSNQPGCCDRCSIL